ncbi:MAG: hypothetical protein ACK4FS_06445 [Flavobacterium sp.]
MITLIPGSGTDTLLFGMIPDAVLKQLGQPNDQYLDEDDNPIWLYHDKQLKLTFYAEEGDRFGYLVTTHPKATLFGYSVIGQTFDSLKKQLQSKRITQWETEFREGVYHHFNEDHWIQLWEEFGVITRIELGALIKNLDEFDWKV